MGIKEEITSIATLALMDFDVSESMCSLQELHGKEILKQAVKASGFYCILKQYLGKEEIRNE